MITVKEVNSFTHLSIHSFNIYYIVYNVRWLDGITNAVDMNVGKLWERVREERTGSAVRGVTKSQTRQGD